MNRIVSTTLALLTVVAPALAQPAPEGEVVVVSEPATTPGCVNGVRYDDQSFETMYAVNGAGADVQLMLFELPPGTNTLDQACICFSRNTGGPASFPFSVLVFDDNGAGGAPGSLIAEIPATATGVAVQPNRTFANVDLQGSGVTLPDNTVYVGASWESMPTDSGRVYFCGDRSNGTPQRPVYVGSEGSTIVPVATLFPAQPPRAIGARVDAPTTGGTPTTCVPSDTVMCLNNNRFRVSATFQLQGQPVTSARVVELTGDTGYLWFFDPANVEAVVKVLNGCALNNRYWLFAGGLTNVRTVISVTDTATGTTRTYTNPQATPFQPIQDTSAFATCP
jgi:hypothetical protein